MTNTNCLENIACPRCGHEDPFQIVVTAVATVTDDGAEVTRTLDWHDRSFTSCPECQLDGSLGDFRIPQAASLPSDPEGMNATRASWANIAIRAFQAATGTADESVLGDLLANVMHWCDRNQQDFDIALERARWHYEAETSSTVNEEAGV
jgi:hypothetical protein